MLYEIYEIFDINILQYLTFRAGIAFFVALFLTLWMMPIFIRWAISKKLGQPINEYVPENHQNKKNTPTMGGIVFVLAVIISTLLTAKIYNIFVIGAIFIILFFSAIGLLDDSGKIFGNKNSAGLTPKQKLLAQILFSFVVALFLIVNNFNTDFYVPFLKYPLFDMAVFAIPFFTLVIVSSSNAVNLTDGLDGLATVPSIFAIFTLAVFAYFTGNIIISDYLLIPHIRDAGELSVVSAGFIGALIGFLWYNSHPAQVFMGDSGSLSLGAYIGYMAIVTKNEVLLILIGFIFVLETVSVIIQVTSFKYRNKRVFLMAPIHHHFEMKKWHENKIIVRFWIIALLSNLIALATLKLR
jgi:phospho-N-acetylmuramoyl-pentapeptide-transferase